MPGYQGHILGGIAAFALTLLVLGSYAANGHTILFWFVCCLFGSLFPDIDVKSKGQKYFYWLILGLVIFVIIKQRYDLLILISLFSILPMLVRHRGIFHEPWFLIALAGGSWLILSSMMPHTAEQSFICVLFFLVGAHSHLFLDRGFKGLRFRVPFLKRRSGRKRR